MRWMDFETAHKLVGKMVEDRCVSIADPHQPDCPLLFVSGEFCTQTGYDFGEVLGHNCRFLQGPDTNPAAVASIRQALDKAEPLTVDILNYRKDGSKFWNRLRIRPLFDDKGGLVYFSGNQNIIKESEVRKEAIHDVVD